MLSQALVEDYPGTRVLRDRFTHTFDWKQGTNERSILGGTWKPQCLGTGLVLSGVVCRFCI
jgi:hypothetical protein